VVKGIISGNLKKILKSKISLNLLIIFAFFIFFTLLSPNYLNIQNFINIGLQSSIVSIAAFGATIIILCGCIDLSVGSIIALGSCISAILMKNNVSTGMAIVITLACTSAISAFNGFIIAKTKIHPFLVTLGTMSIGRGVAYLLTHGETVTLVDKNFKEMFVGYIRGFPISVVYTIIILVITSVILSRTKIGREMYAVGSNQVAAKLSGIKDGKVKFIAFTLAGLFYGIAACIATARIGAGVATYGVGLEVQAIAAAILGGVSFAGGSGTAVGAFTGALLLAFLINGLTIVGVSSYTQMVIQGAVIIIAVYIDTISNKTKY